MDRGAVPLTEIKILHQRADPYDLAVSLNIHRRHLTAEQRRDLIAKLLKAKPEASNVAIAKQAKADDKTVATVRRELEGRSEIPNVAERTDSKGRKQPARKPKGGKAAKSTKAVTSKDTSLIAFNERVLDLIQRIAKHPPDRFARTAVGASDLAKLGRFFTDLSNLKDDTSAISVEQPAEDVKAEHGKALVPKTEVEDPELIRENIDTIDRHGAVVRAYKKVLKVSFLDQRAKDEVSSAISKLITKWQSLLRRRPNERPPPPAASPPVIVVRF